MISSKNQNPLSRGGLKKASRKSRDIQSPSQRRCELNCADSRAVTKRGLFDCEPAHTADRMVQCDKTTCAQWAKEAKCNIQICFHLWQSVNENKCITKVRVPTKVIDENLWNPRRLRVPSLNKIAQMAVRPSPLWEFRAANCFRDLIATLQNENPRRTAVV